jgi:hypothetical protein
MRTLRFFAMLAGLVLIAEDAMAQVVESAQAVAAPPVATDVSPQAALRPSAAMRQIFRQRSQSIRLHHRPIPLQAVAPQAFSRSMQEAPPPPTPTSVTGAAGVGPSAAALTVQLVTNRELIDVETNDFTSVISEPSVAVRGKEILYTANWFSSFSTDGGQTFTYVDPAASFPTPPNEDFCCDQLAYYDRGRDLMVWVLQYIHPTTQGTNRLRVAVARGDDIPARNWRFYDFTPQNVGGWTAEWFDFPAMAASQNHLYLTSNSFGFGSSGGFTRAVLLRLPLDALANYQGFNYQFLATNEVGSLRPVHGTGTTMYVATNRSVTQVRVYEWPEAGSSLTIHDVGVAPWNSTNYASQTGTEWLGRADGRITAGWFAGNRIGVAWTAGSDDTFPFAHVRAARIDAGTWTVVDQPHIWNSTFPFAYPTAAPNSAGDVGIGLAYGTLAGLFPSHAVGVRDDAASAWRLVITAEGNTAPGQPVWGDYFTIQPHGQDLNDWVTAGFALDGGPTNSDVVPRYVHFRQGGPQQTVGAGPSPLALAQSAVRAEPTDSQRSQWLAVQRAAMADPDNPAKLNTFLGQLGRVGDDYVVEGDLLMSEEEVQRYLRTKGSAGALADPGGELIVEVENGFRVYWAKPEDRVLTYAVRRQSFPSQDSYQKVVMLMEQAANAWEEACPNCGIDFRHQIQEDANPSPERVRFIVEYRLPEPGEAGVLAYAFFPNEPPASRYVVVLPAFFATNYDQGGILRHELGHVLGYRHEHILSPDAGCAWNRTGELAQDASFEPLSDYDARSVMHYPCGAATSVAFELSPTDIEQHRKLYRGTP